MCGILAIAGTTIPERQFAHALHTLDRRGPDASGVYTYKNCILGHTRLAIIDLTEGQQPMLDQEANIAITFNGEIYNYQELRTTLEKMGYSFKTHSDTEVILKAYREYGTDCVQHLDGMFAFAIWNDATQELYCARDRFGKKPLYYAYDQNGNLYLASEIKALLTASISPEIDPAAIDAYLALMYVPTWRTIYKNVHTVSPAHYGVYKDKELKTTRYWQLSRDTISTISYEEAKEETRRLIHAAVKKRMIADVEVGAFLSGGVDSTLVTAYAQEYTDKPIKTFSLGYGDYINELPYAQQAAETIGTDHHTMQAGANLIEDIEAYLGHFDQPHGDSADLAQHILSRYTAEHVKVALAGDGGDELFMGYGWYWAYWNRPKLHTIKNFLFSNPYREHLRSITVVPAHMRRHLLHEAGGTYDPHFSNPNMHGHSGTGIEEINWYDLTTMLQGHILYKVDRTSMMHGLEVRSPLLDYQLAEFIYSLPNKFKADRNTGKFLLKDLLAEIMPREFVDRKKQGFGAPVRKWLQEEHFRDYAHKELFGTHSSLDRYVNTSRLQGMFTSVTTRNHLKNAYRIWVILCLAVWLKKHHP